MKHKRKIIAGSLLLLALGASFINFNGRPPATEIPPQSLARIESLYSEEVLKSQPAIRQSLPRDYNDYLGALLKREHNEAARLYRELSPRSEESDYFAEFFETTEDDSADSDFEEALDAGEGEAEGEEQPRDLGWVLGEPLSEAQIEWLVNQQDYIDKLERLGRLEGPPIMTRAQVLLYAESGFFYAPEPDYVFLQLSGRLLLADAQRLLAEHRTEDALARIEGAHKMMNSSQSPSPTFIWQVMKLGSLQTIYRFLAGRLNAGDLDEPTAIRLEELLAESDVRLRDDPVWLENEYVVNRWSYGDAIQREFGDSLFTNPLRRAWRRLTAREAHSAKKAYAHFMEISLYWDNLYEIMVDRQIPEHEIPKRVQVLIDRLEQSKSKLFSVPKMALAFRNHLECQANLQMLRAALAVRQGRDPLPLLQHDPFTGEPFRAGRSGTGWRFWSIGPDGIDQEGQVIYDRAKGSMMSNGVAEGDIVLETAEASPE